MAESNVNFLQDVALPIVALLGSGTPEGARTVNALMGLVQLGQRRQQGRRQDARLQESLDLKRQQIKGQQAIKEREFAAQAPIQNMRAAQADIRAQAAGDIFSTLNAPGPSQQAAQALGRPTFERLQDASQRGEQVPIPQGPATVTPAIRRQRFEQLATTPGGQAQLTAAGFPDVSEAATAERRRAAIIRQKMIPLQREMLQDLRAYTPDIMPPEHQQLFAQAIAQAQSPEDLIQINAAMPPGALKPQSARIEEYKFYANQERTDGRIPLPFLQFQTQQRRASATRITTNVGPSGQKYGEAPQGSVWAHNADGTVYETPQGPEGALGPVAIPIKGSKEYRDIQESAEKGNLTQDQAKKDAAIIVDEINKGLGIIKTSMLPTTGLLGSLIAKVPGTDAYDLGERLGTVRAKIGFKELNLMRQSSDTGGALGPVSDTENRLLQAALGSIRQGQSKEQLISNMNRIREIFLDILHGADRPDRNLEYLTQEDIATINKAQKESRKRRESIFGTQPATDIQTLNPEDLEDTDRFSIEDLERMEREFP